MKDCTAIKVITEALEEYENNFNHKISILESKIILYEKERKAIIIKKDRKEICFISSFSVICVWDEPAIKIVNLNI